MSQTGTIASQLSKLNDEQLINFIENLAPADASAILKDADQALVARLFGKVPNPVLAGLVERANPIAVSNLMLRAHPTHLAKFIPFVSKETFAKILQAANSKRQQEKLLLALPAKHRPSFENYIEKRSRDSIKPGAWSFVKTNKATLEHDRDVATYSELLSLADRERRELEAKYSELRSTAELERRLLKTQEAELQRKIAKLEETLSKQVQQRIETKVPEYVIAAVHLLEEREKFYRTKAGIWSIQGSIVLLVAILGTTALSFYGIHYGPSLTELSWQALLFVSFKGLVVLGVLGLWAKHAFTISNAYMHEAIKRSDRAHAINFGKLYLEVYGNTVERKELIDIFENWNINSDSAFSKANPSGFDPAILERVGDFLKTMKPGKDSS